jgi:hypothetical protein
MLAMAIAVLALVAGAISSLMLLTMCMAGGANSTPEQIRAIKMWMLVITIVGLLTFGGGIWLTAAGRPWTGACVGGLPAAVTFVLIVWLSLK